MDSQDSSTLLDPLTTLRSSQQTICSSPASSMMIDKCASKSNTLMLMARHILTTSLKLRSMRLLLESFSCSRVSMPVRPNLRSSFLLELSQTQKSSSRFSWNLDSRAWLHILLSIADPSRLFLVKITNNTSMTNSQSSTRTSRANHQSMLL